MEKLLNKKDVAEAFGVTVKAIDKWVSERRIPYIKISAKCVRFRPSAIKKYLDRRTVKPQVRPSLRTRRSSPK
jgi:predicted DNA-binding transcriptional regulator AlpA